MKWKIRKKQILLIFVFCLSIFLFILFSSATRTYDLYSGSFNLYITQNNSVGSQLLQYYVSIQHLNATPINTTANIYGKYVNEIYSSTLRFTINLNGKMKILTNLDEIENYIIRVSVNNNNTLMSNQDIFSFSNGDRIVIYFEISYALIRSEQISAVIGIIGTGLFCANPILSYILSNKAKDKFHFLFILMGIGIISIGLIFSFIYG